MLVELLLQDESGHVRPVTVRATQVLVRNDVGTPLLAVAAEYGQPGTQILARIGDPDFAESLRKVGVFESPRIDYIQTPAPPGARLVAGPNYARDGVNNG